MQLQLHPYKKTAPCIFLCKKITFAILLLLYMHVNCVTAKLTCHQCRGINCLRSSYKATQNCFNDLDICATVFDGQTVLAQGCFEQFPEELRNKCSGTQVSEELSSDCFKCNENLCNNLASNSFKCIQCDSETDVNCRTNSLSLKPTRCLMSQTPNEYCFVKQDGDRVIRGCSYTLEEQISCLSNGDCTICQPSELSGCNAIDVVIDDSGSGSGSGDGGSGSGSGGGGSGDGGSGSGSASSGDGGSGSGSGGNDSGSGSGSESSGEGSGDAGSGSGSGDGGSGDGGSGSGSGGGSSGDSGSGSGSGDAGSGSGSGGGSSGDGGSSSGSGNGGSEDGGSGSGSGGNNSGSGSGSETSGSGSGGESSGDPGSGSGTGSGSGGSGNGGSGSGSGNEGSDSGSGDGSDGNGSSILNSHIFILVVHLILIFLVSK